MVFDLASSSVLLADFDVPRLRESQSFTQSGTVAAVQDTIAADLTKSRTPRGLAKVAGASERHLSRLFQEHVGMSIAEYSNRLRVAFAQELLRQTNLDMERVAEQAGFSSPRQLRRAWRKVHKTPPREARADAVA